MARFGFHIRYGQYANDHVVDLPRAEDARQEASQPCCDMIRDIIAALERILNGGWKFPTNPASRFICSGLPYPKC
jgi:hypothetical protein